MSALAGLQLGEHGVCHVHVVAVPCAVGDAEGVHVGVLAEVLELVLLVVGVHGDEHGADLGCGIEEGKPVGYVGSPDADVGSSFHANGDESLGEVVHTLVELRPCESQVAVGIDDIFFVRGDGGPVLKPFAQCALVEGISGRAGFSGVGTVGQGSACHV